MGPFRFRLARIREWQAKRCAAEEEKVRAAMDAVLRLDNLLEQGRTEWRRVEEDIRRPAPLGVAELRGWAAFRQTAFERERALLVQRATAEGELSARRQDLLAARRRLEVLDKIREREWHAWRADTDREIEQIAQENSLHRRFRDSHGAQVGELVVRHRRNPS